METFQQRPITPPSDRKQADNLNYLRDQDSLNDSAFLDKQRENMHAQMPPASTVPTNLTTASVAPTNMTTASTVPTNMTTAPAIHKESNPFASGTTTTGMPSRTMGDHKRFQSTQRNDTTHRIENEVLSILQWRNPVRSGAIFAITVGSILLTRWYSLLQIGSSLLTLAIGINLVYVNLVLQSQKVLTNQDAAHPY
ncbi:hypothetical protein CU098_013393, partial [Rhizopus stolonifer]